MTIWRMINDSSCDVQIQLEDAHPAGENFSSGFSNGELWSSDLWMNQADAVNGFGIGKEGKI